MKGFKPKALLALLIAVFITVGNCAPFALPQTSIHAQAASAKINKKKASLVVGQTLQLKVSGTSKKVSWKSSNKKIATVSKSGKVKAKKTGNVTITAKVGKAKLTCKVTVKIGLSKSKLTLNLGETAKIALKGAKAKSFTSGNNSIATVSAKGVVTAVGKGSTKITCKSKAGKKYTCNVTVTEENIALNTETLDLIVGQSAQLSVNTKRKVNWSTSSSKIATVDQNGNVTAKKYGKTTISAKVDQKTLKCTVNASYDSNLVHTITFNSDGAQEIPSQQVRGNDRVQTPVQPYKLGFTFKGWYRDGSLYDFSEPVGSSFTLVAKWGAMSDNLNDNVTDLGDVIYLQSVGAISVNYEKGGVVGSIEGKFTNQTVNSKNDAATVLRNAKAIIAGKNESYTVDASNITASSNNAGSGNETYYKAGQEINGIPVIGNEVILSVADNGEVTGLYNNYDARIRHTSTGTSINESTAKTKAIDAVMSDEDLIAYMQENETAQVSKDELLNAFKSCLVASARKVIYCPDDAEPALMWEVNVTVDTTNMTTASVAVDSDILLGAVDQMGDTNILIRTQNAELDNTSADDNDGTGDDTSSNASNATSSTSEDSASSDNSSSETSSDEGNSGDASASDNSSEGSTDSVDNSDAGNTENTENVENTDNTENSDASTGDSSASEASTDETEKTDDANNADNADSSAEDAPVDETNSSAEEATVIDPNAVPAEETEEEGNVLIIDEKLDYETMNAALDNLNAAPVIDRTYYLASNGEVSFFIDNQDSWDDWTVTMADHRSKNREINVQKDVRSDNKVIYRLRDSSRNITTKKVGVEKVYKIFKNPVTPGDYEEFEGSNFYAPAVSAHANMAAVYDYYKDKIGRNSYDGNGKDIVVTYDFFNSGLWKGKYYNAYWTPSDQQFVIGNDGDLGDGLDVLGHEFTHAVVNYVVGNGSTTSLTYYGESGALNESYADIMGSLIENKSDDGLWLLGEDTKKAIRSMADPSLYDQPAHYSNRETGTDDNGGVHKNSGIFNHAAYLMITDPEHHRTSGISHEKWAKVFYNSMFELSCNADFLDGRRAVLSAANKLGLTAEQQQAIKDAFDAVGICELNLVQFTLTWGEVPRDLDSHLVKLDGNGGKKFHIYYSNKRYEENNEIVADLDYDDTSSFGPENTSIYDMSPGVYYFFVHDFTNRSKSSSTAMAGSGARVQMFVAGSQLKDYYVTPSSNGTIWTVCRIEIDQNGSVSVQDVNTYDYGGQNYPDTAVLNSAFGGGEDAGLPEGLLDEIMSEIENSEKE